MLANVYMNRFLKYWRHLLDMPTARDDVRPIENRKSWADSFKTVETL